MSDEIDKDIEHAEKETKRLVGGWVGAAIVLEEAEGHFERRRRTLWDALARVLYVATKPDTPAEERAALLDAAVKFAGKVHERLRGDRLMMQTFHLKVLEEAEKAGATSHVPFQERVGRANVTSLVDDGLSAELRAMFLDRCAPDTDVQSVSGEEK